MYNGAGFAYNHFQGDGMSVRAGLSGFRCRQAGPLCGFAVTAWAALVIAAVMGGCAPAMLSAGPGEPMLVAAPSEGARPDPTGQSQPLAQATDYDQAERTILEDVQDDGQLYTSALYVLLRRAEMLPDDRQALAEAHRPDPLDLWDRPARYRGRLIRVVCEYAGEPPESLTSVADRTPRWPHPKPIWAAHVLVEDRSARPPKKRMLVLMGHKPRTDLRRDQGVEVVGLFYKRVTMAQKTEPGEPRGDYDYPIIVAKALYPADGGAKVPPTVYLTFFLIAALLLGFVLLRRYLGRARARGKQRKPLRFEGRPEGGEEVDASPEAVDEDLRREVAAYLAERRGAMEGEHADNAKDNG